MALATATITYDLANLVGIPHHQGTSVTATTNIPGQVVVDTDGNQVRLGSGKGSIAADGTGQIDVWVPGVDSNPASWQTYIHIRHRDPMARGGHATRTLGPFTITASGDLADLIEEQAIPPEYATALIAELDGYADEAAAAASSASASAAAAAASAALADSYIVADLNTSDGQVEALIESPSSLTSAALAGAFARALHIQPGKNGVVGNGTGDDTVAMQAILDQVSPALGVTDVIVHSGTYMIDGVNEAQPSVPTRWIGGGIKPKTGTRLLMAPDAVLKVIPNAAPAYAIIYLGPTVTNVTISGGVLQGDRVAHTYATGTGADTHEFGYGIGIKAAQDILIEDVTVKECTGDGLCTESQGYISYTELYGPYYPVRNLTIRRCRFDGNRRNNISLVAIDNALVENCVISNGGATVSGNVGIAPKFGLDIEASWDGPNPLHEAVDVVVRGNYFLGNQDAALSNFNGRRVVIEGNHSDSIFSCGFGSSSTITNNVLVNVADTTKIGIGSNNNPGSTRSGYNVVSGNVVRGFKVGIQISNPGTVCSDNVVYDFHEVGVSAYYAPGAVVSGNNIVGKLTGGAANSRGIDLGLSPGATVDGNIVSQVVTGVLASVTSDDSVISNNRLFDAVAVTSAIGVNMQSANLRVTGNAIHNFRLAINVASATTGAIEQNRITKGRQAILIAAATGGLIKGNTINLPGHADGQVSEVQWSGTSVVTFEGNIVRGSTTYPINATNATNGVSRIVGNTFENTSSSLSLSGGKHEVVRNTFIGFRASGSFTTGAILLGGTQDKTLILGNVCYAGTGSTSNYGVLVYTAATVANTRIIKNVHIGSAILGGTASGTEVLTDNDLVAV